MIRVYRAKQIGTGAYTDPYRSILHDFIDINQGDSFTEIDLPSGRRSICVLDARQSVHDAIVAYEALNPGSVNYLSTLHADMKGLRTQYEQNWSSLPLAFRTKAENLLGVDGLVDFTGTIKDILKRILIKYSQNQKELGGDFSPEPTTITFAGDKF